MSIITRGIRYLFKYGPKQFFKRLFSVYTTPSYMIKKKYSHLISPSKVNKLKLSETEELMFPICEKIKVSIIIPVLNKWQYTYHSLSSILENTKGNEYEVIIIDNGSTDETQEMLKRVKNIVIHRNKENFGFSRACNLGAEISNGEYLMFLNNDTYVLPKWLEYLLKTFKTHKDAGLVGSKLLFHTGHLQEAGYIVWKNKLIENYGRWDNPQKPEYNYVKEVDYCSGASILVKKHLFEEIGGFDTTYSPAYSEDTDLAFKIRSNGYKVLYQPKSEVIHIERVSSGGERAGDFKGYQERHLKQFYERWSGVIEKENLEFKCVDRKKDLFLARDRSFNKRIILVIDQKVPEYDKDAGSVRMYEYLKIFVEMGAKVIFWPDNLYPTEPYTSELQNLGIEVIYGIRRLKKYIKTYGKVIDFFYLSRPHIAIKYIDAIKEYSDAKIIYDVQDLHYLRTKRRAKVTDNADILKTAEELKRQEVYLMEKSDATISLSIQEQEIIKKINPVINAHVLPYVQSVTDKYAGLERREDLVFIGGFQHTPNQDGICWFVKEVFPFITKEMSKVKLFIIGSNPSAQILDLGSVENVIITGYIADVSPSFEKARVFVAPLRYGAGYKGKIAHAMSYGLPVVTTSIGAEGMNLSEYENVLIGDTPKEFADKTIAAYKDEDLWNKLSQNSLKYVRENCSSQSAIRKFAEIFEQLISG